MPPQWGAPDTAAGHFITTAGTEWCNPSQRPSSSSSSPIIMASAQLQSDGDTPWAPAAVTYCDISLALPLQPGFGARERSAQKPQTQSSEAQGQRSARVCSSLPSQLALHCGGRRQEWHSARCTRTSPDFTAPVLPMRPRRSAATRAWQAMHSHVGVDPAACHASFVPGQRLIICRTCSELLRQECRLTPTETHIRPHTVSGWLWLHPVPARRPRPAPPTHPPTAACITTKGSISVG